MSWIQCDIQCTSATNMAAPPFRHHFRHRKCPTHPSITLFYSFFRILKSNLRTILLSMPTDEGMDDRGGVTSPGKLKNRKAKTV